MAVVKQVLKKAVIDGKEIEWNVLSITGYLGGDFQTLELKLDRTQAMLAGMLLNSTEEPTVSTSRGGEVDINVNREKKN